MIIHPLGVLGRDSTPPLQDPVQVHMMVRSLGLLAPAPSVPGDFSSGRGGGSCLSSVPPVENAPHASLCSRAVNGMDVDAGESPCCSSYWFHKFTFPQAVNEGFLLSTSSSTLIITCLVYNSHFNLCEIVFQFGSDLHFPYS